MTRFRVALAVAVIAAAVLVGPEAARPVLNSADGIVLVLPFLFIAACWPLLPRRGK